MNHRLTDERRGTGFSSIDRFGFTVYLEDEQEFSKHFLFIYMYIYRVTGLSNSNKYQDSCYNLNRFEED